MGAATSGVFAVASEGAVADGRVAFASLYREHAAFTWSCLRRLGVPASAVDDAMQELWVTAHRRLDTLRSASVAKAWLLGIARRIASHHRRAEQRHRRRVDAFVEHAPRSSTSERASSMIVESILASLDERVREAFVLSELEGWSAAEISAATGANTNTIYWRVRTAKHQLQARLAEDDLDARVVALREQTTPPRKAIAHAWMLLVPQLDGPSAAIGSLGWWAAAKVAMIGAAATVGVAMGVDRAQGGAVDPVVVTTVEASRDTGRSEVTSAMPVAVAAVLPIASSEHAPLAAPASSIARAPRGPSRVAAPAVAPEPEAIAAAPTHDIDAEEAAQLAAIKADLAAGRTTEATRALDRHRERFPDSRLADVRAAISIELGCTHGDAAKARAELASWRARLGPAKASRLDAICGAKDPS